MAFKGEQGSSGVPDKSVRRVTRGRSSIPHIEGLRTSGSPDVEGTIVFLRQLETDHDQGKLRHRGRHGTGSGMRSSRRQEDSPYRSGGRQGSW